MLNIKDKRCVVVGGGPVALRRAIALLEAGGTVTVVAPDILPELAALPIQTHHRAYQTGDLNDARLVVIASNDQQVNGRVMQDAIEAGVLINRADAPDQGDFTVPATQRLGPITLAVDTGGSSATAASAIRDELADALDPDWPKLIKLARPWRAILQARYPDAAQRVPKLKNLCGPRARAILKDEGETALQAYYDAMANTPTDD